MGRKLNVGDVVKTRYGKGEVRAINDKEVLVSHYDWDEGHNASASNPELKLTGGHAWYFRLSEVELLPNYRKITIIRDGNKVTAKIGEKEAVARCNPEDTFDLKVGATLALERLFEAPEAPLGYVKVIDNGGTYSSYETFFEEAGCKQFKKRWKRGTPIENEIYKVLFRAPHETFPRDYVLVIENDNGQVFLIADDKNYVVHLDERPFNPYLSDVKRQVGFIGEKTTLTAIFGEELHVGDVVESCFVNGSGMIFTNYICKDKDGYYIDGERLYSLNNVKNGICKYNSDEIQVRKIKSYKDLSPNESYNFVKAVLKKED